jgi:hypothetical protein
LDVDVYNLEFRCRSCEMDIAGYRFSRVDEYPERLQALAHRVVFQSEFSIQPCTGTHQLTARVRVPDPEPPAVLPWSDPQSKALDDLTLLLSLFTGRQVFVLRGHNREAPLVLGADPRETLWGQVIRLSIPYKQSPPRNHDDPYSTGDDGLQIHLNRVYALMRTEQWREKYKGGYYLFLFRSALLERTIESAFSQCWTIWEHLFSILNEPWMSKRGILNTDSSETIAFLLVAYALRERLHEKEKPRLRDLATIRNRLIHYGQFPEGSRVRDDAVLFTQMTEWIVSRSLGLEPSEVFDTLDLFEEFLSRVSCNA